MKVLVYFSILPIIFILFIGGMLTTNSAFGLSCDATDVLWSFEEADAIFLGKALSKEYQSNPRHEDRFDAVTLFSVIEPYKGIYGEKINITSSEWKWGVNFTENSDYVIFANNNDGMFEHALCTPTQLVSESNLSEIRKISQNYILPPFSQIKFGVSPNEIQCKQNLVLIQKYDGTPACVTESTKQKLIERGWSLSPNNTIKIKKTDLFLNYTMSNGVVKTAQLSDIAYAQFYYETMGVRLKEGHALPTEYSINLELNSPAHKGSISLQIPKRILDSLENQNDNWIIEIDNGTMSSQSHVKMEQNNSIDINYPAETNHIRIIGSVLE